MLLLMYSVGKTSLIKKFTKNVFTSVHNPTVGIDTSVCRRDSIALQVRTIIIIIITSRFGILAMTCINRLKRHIYVHLIALYWCMMWTTWCRSSACVCIGGDDGDDGVAILKRQFLASCDFDKPDAFPFVVIGTQIDRDSTEREVCCHTRCVSIIHMAFVNDRWRLLRMMLTVILYCWLQSYHARFHSCKRNSGV